MKKRKTWWVAATILLSAGWLAACSGGGGKSTDQGAQASPSASSSGASAQPQQVELRVSWWGNADRAKLYNQIFDMYEKQHPNVKIVREWSSFGDYWPKLSTQIAGGNQPDIFGLHVLLYGGEYANKNVLEPLQPYVDKGLIDLSDWDQAVIDAGKLNGQLYALPKGITISALIANATAIKGLGLELPQPTTMADLKNALTQIRQKLPKDQYPMTDASFDDHLVESFMRSKGKSFMTKDGKGLGFAKEDLVEFWGYFEEFRKQGLVVPAQLTAESAGQPAENSLFVKKRVVLDVKPSNWGKIYSRSMPNDELAIIRLPGADNYKFRSGENLQAPSFVISNKSKYKEEAAKLISWFVNDVEAQKIYNLENGIPGAKHVREALKPSLHPMDVQAIQHMEAVMKDVPPTDYRPEKASQVFTLYKKYLEQLAFGRMSLQQAVDGFFNEVQNTLSK